MKEIKTKAGTIYKKGNTLFDSDKVLLVESDKKTIKNIIRQLKVCDDIGDWLSQYEATCWSNKISYLLDRAIDCVKGHLYYTDKQKKDSIAYIKKHIKEYINRVGDTYILFGYDNF